MKISVLYLKELYFIYVNYYLTRRIIAIITIIDKIHKLLTNKLVCCT